MSVNRRELKAKQVELLRKWKRDTDNLENSSLKGMCVEHMVRQLVRMLLDPASHLGVGYGEIVFSDGTHSSQIDVIVYDKKARRAHYRCGGVVVVPIEAVKIVIEIKAVFALRSEWELEMQRTSDVFRRIKMESSASTLYFCLSSDKYTLDDHHWQDYKIHKYAVDDLFVLSTRSGTTTDELARFAESIRAVR